MATFEPADYRSQQPLGLVLSFYKINIVIDYYNAERGSQQPLGLVLSFYRLEMMYEQNAIKVSTAAWACIEFLH